MLLSTWAQETCPCKPGNADSICVRGAFEHEGQLVMTAEIPKHFLLSRRRNVGIFCGGKKHLAKVEDLRTNEWTYQAFSKLTHTFAKISCPWKEGRKYDLDNLALFVGSTENRCKVPLRDVVHLRPSEPQPYKYRLCAMTGVLFGKGNFVDEWLEHQRVIGVQHIIAYVVVNGSNEMKIPTFQASPLFQSRVKKGEITVVPWNPWLHPSQVYHRSQHLAYSDYLFRFRGLCEWTAFADTDDFFTDFTTGHNLLKSIEAHQKTDPKVNMIRFCWQMFYPDCGRKPNVPLVDSMLYGRRRPLSNTKHVTRTINVTDIGIHNFWEPSKYICGPHEVWHIRHGFPGAEGTVFSFRSDNSFCPRFRLPPDFYQMISQASPVVRGGQQYRH
jgi:hypothetical protein